MIFDRASDIRLPVVLEVQVGAFGPDGELMSERRYEPADFDDDLVPWLVGERRVDLRDGTVTAEDRAAMAKVADEALSWVAAEHETAAFSAGTHLPMQWDSTIDNTERARRGLSSDIALVVDMEGRPHHERHGSCVLCKEPCPSCDCDPHMVATARVTVARSPA